MRFRSVRGVRRSAALGVVVAVGLASLLGGCSLSSVPIAVVGHDADGTLVVGATDCTGGISELDRITVSRRSELGDLRPIWVIDDDSYGSGSGATPSRLDEVGLVAVGDPDPWEWTTTTPLEGPVPTSGTVQVDFADDLTTVHTLELDVVGPAGRYDVIADDRRLTGVTAGEAIAAIEDACDTFDGGRFALVLGITGAGLLVGGIVVGALTIRQMRRAGTAAAARRAAGQG